MLDLAAIHVISNIKEQVSGATFQRPDGLLEVQGAPSLSGKDSALGTSRGTFYFCFYSIKF